MKKTRTAAVTQHGPYLLGDQSVLEELLAKIIQILRRFLEHGEALRPDSDLSVGPGPT